MYQKYSELLNAQVPTPQYGLNILRGSCFVLFFLRCLELIFFFCFLLNHVIQGHFLHV